MRLSRFFLFAPLIVACDTEEPKPDLVQQTKEIQKVFESHEAYSVRRLDSMAVEGWLRANPASLIDSTDIRRFYKRRNFQYAWFVNDSLSQAAAGFFSLVNSADTAFREVAGVRDRLAELMMLPDSGTAVTPCDSCQLQLELALTAQFFRFADKRYGGVIGKDLRELDWFIPRRKKNYDQLLDSLTAGHMDLSPIEPVHPQYALLKQQLKHYYELDTLVSWEPLSLGTLKKLVPGDSATWVPDLRQRLMVLGDLVSHEGDSIVLSSEVYDSLTVEGVKGFQVRHGLHPDGVIGKGAIAALNHTPRQRVRTLLVNMERLRWVPERTAPDLLLVNIPEFKLHVFEADTEAFSMDVVVGNSATRTVIFSDTLSRIVFSPTWSVPVSIVKNEILPAMRKNPNYLASKGMSITGGSASLPSIVQLPGASNALGRVKFLFPNDYSIYFHDTPSKGGFAREKRAFSHGCIRLSEPRKLAEYLLRNDSLWPADSIEVAMFREKERYVRLKEKRPVTIGYFTAWVDRVGRLNFRDDVYGHDERLATELFTEAPVVQ